jgi:hypothetical protein
VAKGERKKYGNEGKEEKRGIEASGRTKKGTAKLTVKEAVKKGAGKGDRTSEQIRQRGS